MSTLQIDPKRVAQIIERLSSNPTASELDLLVEDFTLLGYWAASQQGVAELAEAERKYAEAEAVVKAKEEDAKLSAAVAEAKAAVATYEFRRKEIKERANAKKLANLMNAVEQTINAIKFLHRNDSFQIGVKTNGGTR